MNVAIMAAQVAVINHGYNSSKMEAAGGMGKDPNENITAIEIMLGISVAIVIVCGIVAVAHHH